MVKIIFLFLLSSNAYSFFENRKLDCLDSNSQSIDDLLNWWGATVEQIQKSSCKSIKSPSEIEIDAVIKSRATGKINETVLGINFKDESPVLIKTFKEFTKLMPSTPAHSSKCEKVLCAMEAIWGRELAKKILYIKLKHNFNASEFGYENSDKFTINEINDVILGLDDLPEHLIPLGQSNQRLSRFKRGYVLKVESKSGEKESNTPVVDTIANSTVLLFDGWSKRPSAERQYAIFHELAHNISNKKGLLDVSPEWLKLSEWVKKGDSWKSGNTKCLISGYSKDIPMDDFAESVSAYRYNPGPLKKKCPEKYKFIQDKVFGGIEYTDSALCMSVPAEKIALAQKELSKEAMAKIGSFSVSEKDIHETCAGAFHFYPIHRDELTLCYFKVQNFKFFDSQNPKILETLKNLGIGNSKANQIKIAKLMNKSLMKDETFINASSMKITQFQSSIENILMKSFTPEILKDTHLKKMLDEPYLWSHSLKKCGAAYFTESEDKVNLCQIREIIKQERIHGADIFFGYNKPKIFSDKATDNILEMKDKAFATRAYKRLLTTQVFKAQKEKFLQIMVNHINSINLNLYKLNDWEKMSPENFCKTTYGNGTSETESIGVSKNSSIPLAYENCVREQSKSKKRFEFNSNDLIKLLSPKELISIK